MRFRFYITWSKITEYFHISVYFCVRYRAMLQQFHLLILCRKYTILRSVPFCGKRMTRLEISMFENMTEEQARAKILEMVSEYCDSYHKTAEYKEGDRIPYARRVYDHEEMVNLVDSSLEFWLTAGRYTDEFDQYNSDFDFIIKTSYNNSGYTFS